MRATFQQAFNAGVDLKINFSHINPNTWWYAINSELEHGTVHKDTNITNDNLIKTGKIVIAHLREMPDYYKRLRVMESIGEKYWNNKTKPRIYSP